MNNKKYPLQEKNSKTINIFYLDVDLATKLITKKYIDSLKTEYGNYIINFFQSDDNEKAINAISQMEEVHILLINQYRENGNNTDFDNELRKLKKYPLKIIYSASEPNEEEKRYIDFIIKPTTLEKFNDKLKPVINLVKQLNKYAKKKGFTFSEIIASIPDFVIELGAENVVNYFETNKIKKAKNKKNKKTSDKSSNVGLKSDKSEWWNNLSDKWKKLFIINRDLDRFSNMDFFSKTGFVVHEIFDRFSLDNYDDLYIDIGMGSIKQFDCSGMGLTDLEPLSILSELETLDCSNNKITSLHPIRRSMKLAQLNCSSNPLLEDIEEIIYFSELFILLAHDLPKLRRTILPPLKQMMVLSIIDSPIAYTQETANHIIDLYTNYTNVPPLVYKELSNLSFKKGNGNDEVPEEARFFAPTNCNGTTIQMLKHKPGSDEKLWFSDKNIIDILFIPGSGIYLSDLPPVFITNNIFDKNKQIHKELKFYHVGYDSSLLDVLGDD